MNSDPSRDTGLLILPHLILRTIFRLILIGILVFVPALLLHLEDASADGQKQKIHALYIPLADHYAALVAFERYRDQMEHADFQIEQMKNWDYLRAYFQSGEVDMAFVMSPLAMDMFNQKPHFRWIGLMHRDGNALAINDLINQLVQLAPERKDRKPDEKVAIALQKIFRDTGQSTLVGVPHLLSTHTVVLYRYLKSFGVRMVLKPHQSEPVEAIVVPPPKSPAFIKSKSNRAQAAAFEQSLPWADVVETGGYGHVAWYSKDVMPWKYGHVECIALATDAAIADKQKAVREVMYYIHQAGMDIERAREQGGEALESIVEIIRKHIPLHNREAIIASLSPELRVINYEHLNVDKAGLKQIMDLAVEGGILKQPVDIDAFSDTRFEIELNVAGL